MKLLPYNKQASSKLFPVGCIITDEKSLLTLSDNDFSDVHCDLRVCSQSFHVWRFRGLISDKLNSAVLALHLDDV